MYYTSAKKKKNNKKKKIEYLLLKNSDSWFVKAAIFLECYKMHCKGILNLQKVFLQHKISVKLLFSPLSAICCISILSHTLLLQ